MLMHPIMEQVRLHHAAPVDGGAVAELDEVGLGQPVRLAPDATSDLRAQGPQPDVQHRRAGRGVARTTARRPPRRRCRPARCATRTSSTAGGRRPGAVRPGPTWPRVVTAAATAPRPAMRTSPPAGPRPTSRRSSHSQPTRPRRTPRPSATLSITGTSRHSSTSARATLSRVGGLVGAGLVDLLRPPAQLRRAGCRSTTCRPWPWYAVAPPTARATRPRLGTLRPGAAIPELPRKACLPIFTALDAEPAAAELVAAEQGVVGEERPVVDRGQLGDQQHGRRLDLVADLGAQQPQPERRQRARVQREEPGARLVEQPERSPTPARRPAVHRVVPGSSPIAEQPHAQPRPAGPATSRPTTVASGSDRDVVRTRRRPTVSRQPGDTASRPRGRRPRAGAR